MDITYLYMRCGFLYPTSIIGVDSRYIVGLQLTRSLNKETQTICVSEAVRHPNKPEIINSDQGSQYTNEHLESTLKLLGIIISIDGKGRAIDKAYIKRF